MLFARSTIFNKIITKRSTINGAVWKKQLMNNDAGYEFQHKQQLRGLCVNRGQGCIGDRKY